MFSSGAGKGTETTGEGGRLSTLVTAESTSRSPHRQGRMALRVLSRNYNAPSRLFAHRLFVLCPVFVRCRLKLVSRNSRSCHRRGNHPRNEPGPTKSGALRDASRTKAPELLRCCLFIAGQCSLAHTGRNSRSR